MRTFPVVLLAGMAFGQPAAKTPPAFEAADVHVSAPVRNPYPRFMNRNGLLEYRNATIVDLIAYAYGIDFEKVVGGPNWLEMNRYDVIARLPAHADRDAPKPMLQALLADRFRLAVHNGTTPVPAFVLTVLKPGLFKKSEGAGDGFCKFEQGKGNATTGPPAFIENCTNVTLAKFAEQVRYVGFAGIYLDRRIVVDKTGLGGAWDLSFHYTYRMMPGQGETVTIFDALEKQLGLKLELARVPLPVIVVDHVNETPTENIPNIAAILKAPPTPTEFEVADIKPSAPGERGRFQIRNGDVTMTGMTLKYFVRQAWSLTDELISGAPKWMDEDRFNIIAKATTDGPPNAAMIDNDTIWMMMRALLKERFKLQTHMEERSVNAFNLVAVKPKIKKADPNSRTRIKEGPGEDGKDPRDKNPVLSRLITVQNLTMAQFAARLRILANGYVHTPVTDMTGLEGGWDFTLSFSPAGMDQYLSRSGRGGQDAPGGVTQASDPSGAISLFDAMEKQLGLKLETVKRMVPVLVIDHVEEKPTEN